MNEHPAPSASRPDQVSALLTAAGQAPSLHNSQPWRFRLRPRSIELHADLDRQLPVADPDGRELRLACGAALFNLRLALHGLGIRPTVTLFPDPAQPALLAAVRRGGHKPPTPHQLRLLQAIPARQTNRRPSPTSRSARPSSTRCGRPPSGGRSLAADGRRPDATPDAAAAGRPRAPRATRRPPP